MRKRNDYWHYQPAWRLALMSIALATLFPANLSLATYSPLDYFQITYAPAVFSKTVITGEEVFHTTIKSSGVAVKAPPPADAVRFSYRYTGVNKTTGEEVVLNSLQALMVEPFPQTQGGSYEATNVASLQFPTGSSAGSYAVIEEIINVEMKDPGADWQRAPKPTKPLPPAKPSAPTKPASPTKPSAPTKPSSPIDGERGGTKPSKPPEPTQPAEPARPPEPTRPAKPTAPPGPRREIGIVAYAPSVTPEPKPESSLTPSPKLAPSSSPTLSKLIISPSAVVSGTSVVGTVTVSRAMYGQIVQLSADSNTAITLPASVTVKAGESSASFNISTNKVVAPANVTVTAVLAKSRKLAVLTINPLVVSALTVSTASVVDGTSITGVVTLNGPALAGGQIIQLSATPSTAITLPGSVTVKAGESSASFDISAKSLTPSLSVTVMATLNSSQKTAQLTVNPELTVSALSISPASVTNGDSAVGTVTLSSPAPKNNKVVQLSAIPNDSLTLPGNVVVKAGATTATFDIKTKTVTSPVNVTISATLDSSQKTALFTINPTLAVCAGVCVPVGKPGPSGAWTNQGTSGCKPAQISWYSCGFFGRSKCYYNTPQICYVAVPSPLSAVSVSQTAVVGGASLVGTVTLKNPAPQGGLAVRLSGPSAFLTIPPDITIPSGAISGTFTIGTKVVTSAVRVGVTATRDNFERSAEITINPAPIITVAVLTVSPSSVTGGASLAGTVTLSAAPAGNQVVLLSSDASSALTLPANIVIKDGETSGTFNIATKSVSSPVTAVITAALPSFSLRNSYKTVTFIVNPVSAPCSYSCRPGVATCNKNEVAQPWLSCPATTRTYRCGFWRMRTCTTQVSAICCKAK